MQKKQETILFKLNTGLGYDSNNTCNPLQTQKHISPQLAKIESITAEEANKRFKTATHSYDAKSMMDYKKHYPYVFDSITNPKWAGVL